VGAAGGIERIIDLMKEQDIKPSKERTPEIFLAQLGSLPKRKTLRLMEEFRKVNIQVLESLGRDSLKAQLAMADKAGAKYTLILGQKEALEKSIIIRQMSTGKQKAVKLEKVVKEVRKILKK
jgi:histidyl-tRNA synthetase